jgi:hypothetical protein
VIDDVRHFSPELAARLGIASPRSIAVRTGVFR